MNQIKVVMLMPGPRDSTITISVECLVDPDDAEEQGGKAAKMLRDFTAGFAEEGLV